MISLKSFLKNNEKTLKDMTAMERTEIDLKENYLNWLNKDILAILLKDHSSHKNIIWATDNYAHKGPGYQKYDTTFHCG